MSPSEESNTWNVNFKMTLTDKTKIAEFCADNDITVSEFFRRAGDLLMRCYPFQDRIEMVTFWFRNDKGLK